MKIIVTENQLKKIVLKEQSDNCLKVSPKTWNTVDYSLDDIKNGKIIKQWVEEGKTDNADIDPFSNTDPGTVINWIKGDYGRDKLGL